MSDEKIYRLIKLFIAVTGRLPESFLNFLSDCLGQIWYLFDKRHRHVVIDNIQLAYPEKFSSANARRFAKKNFKHISRILIQLIWSYANSPPKIFKRFEIRGIEHLLQAKKKGRGVLCLLCHMGNFELLSAGFAKVGIDPYVLYRKLDFSPLERLMLEVRQRFGATMIPLRKASKKIETILKGGGVVGTLLDQNVDWYKGVFVDFFGTPACTNNGFAKLVLKTKAPVITAFIRMEHNQFVVEFFPEIPLDYSGDTIRDIEKNTQNYVWAVEAMVRRCPEQYFWVHRRWKTKPYCLLKERD